jgi:farnesyl-diphosphate farnesyltransferase
VAPTLQNLLRETSRSFYLTMRVLPAAIRSQIGLAYLLARAADTIADTGLVPVASRLSSLAAFRDRILAKSPTPLDLSSLAQNQATPAERALLQQCEQAVQVLDSMADEDRRRVREVLTIIISGQELDLQRFAPSDPPQLAALETDAELDDYTWRVAGCVGEFWTHLCRAHLFPKASLDDAALLRDGLRFGKGLQLVNILRDIPADLRNGRCYIPRQSLAAAGLVPADLLSAANEPRFRSLYNSYLDLATAHLQAGWHYTLALPRAQLRLRLACAWPVLLGARTLRQLRAGNVLDANHRIKVPRVEFRSIVMRSVFFLAWPPAWDAQFKGEIG